MMYPHFLLALLFFNSLHTPIHFAPYAAYLSVSTSFSDSSCDARHPSAIVHNSKRLCSFIWLQKKHRNAWTLDFSPFWRWHSNVLLRSFLKSFRAGLSIFHRALLIHSVYFSRVNLDGYFDNLKFLIYWPYLVFCRIPLTKYWVCDGHCWCIWAPSTLGKMTKVVSLETMANHKWSVFGLHIWDILFHISYYTNAAHDYSTECVFWTLREINRCIYVSIHTVGREWSRGDYRYRPA